MRQPQEVTITWMPYPENKPTRSGEYMIQHKERGITCARWNYSLQEWREIPTYPDSYHILDSLIVAYAELPEGYKEDK